MASRSPWLDPREIDELSARYPGVPRSSIEEIFDTYWPVKNDVEAALEGFVAVPDDEARLSPRL